MAKMNTTEIVSALKRGAVLTVDLGGEWRLDSHHLEDDLPARLKGDHDEDLFWERGDWYDSCLLCSHEDTETFDLAHALAIVSKVRIRDVR